VRDDARDAAFGQLKIACGEIRHRIAALIDDVDEDVARLHLRGGHRRACEQNDERARAR